MNELFIRTRKNEIIILYFIKQKRKHMEMAFLTSRSPSKHILFAGLTQNQALKIAWIVQICNKKMYIPYEDVIRNLNS